MTNSRVSWRSAFAAMAFLAVSATGELSVPPLTGRVVDQAGILSDAEEKQLVERIQGLEEATGGQMAVLIIPSLENDALESFSMRVAESWQIGRRGKDNGVLLLVCHQDRKIRLEVGYGWEGEINDAKAGDIIRGMGPFFRERQFAEGIDVAIADVQEFVTGDRPQGAPAALDGEPDEPPVIVILLFFLVVLVLIGVGNGWQYRSRGFGVMIFMGLRESSGGGRSGSGGGYSGGGGSFGGGGASGGW